MSELVTAPLPRTFRSLAMLTNSVRRDSVSPFELTPLHSDSGNNVRALSSERHSGRLIRSEEVTCPTPPPTARRPETSSTGASENKETRCHKQ